MELAWVERILQLCKQATSSFFFKQWGGVQKSKAGRLLNGRTYDEMPERIVAPIPSPQTPTCLCRSMDAQSRGLAIGCCETACCRMFLTRSDE